MTHSSARLEYRWASRNAWHAAVQWAPMYNFCAGQRGASTPRTRLSHIAARCSVRALIEASRSSFGGLTRLRCEHATTRAILGGRVRTPLACWLALLLRLLRPLNCGVCVVAVDALFIHN